MNMTSVPLGPRRSASRWRRPSVPSRSKSGALLPSVECELSAAMMPSLSKRAMPAGKHSRGAPLIKQVARERSAERAGAIGDEALGGGAAGPGAEQAPADADRQEPAAADRLADRRDIREFVEQAMERHLADDGAVIGNEPLDHRALAEFGERVGDASGNEQPRGQGEAVRRRAAQRDRQQIILAE